MKIKTNIHCNFKYLGHIEMLCPVWGEHCNITEYYHKYTEMAEACFYAMFMLWVILKIFYRFAQGINASQTRRSRQNREINRPPLTGIQKKNMTKHEKQTLSAKPKNLLTIIILCPSISPLLKHTVHINQKYKQKMYLFF